MAGSPISHSLSPALHRYAYTKLGLTGWSYSRIELGAAELADFASQLDASWRGLSLTMPLKEAALGLASPGQLSESAQLVGAANTLIIQADGTRAVHNTDIPGLVATFSQLPNPPQTAVILGGGATARCTLVALAELGCAAVTVIMRDPARAKELHALAAGVKVQLTVQSWTAALPESELVISTVPGSAAARLAANVVGRTQAIVDVAYHPWPTPLVRAARAANLPAVTGLCLLAQQAALQVQLMTGQTIAAAELEAVAGQAVQPK